MKTTKPVRAKQYQMRMERIAAHIRSNSPMMRIPGIAVSECQMLLEAYHGGRWRAILALIRQAVYLTRHEIDGRFIMWICDTAGWTKIYDIPETQRMRAHKQRHGRKCSGSPNCENMNCIEDSVPRWFQQLTKSFWTK